MGHQHSISTAMSLPAYPVFAEKIFKQEDLCLLSEITIPFFTIFFQLKITLSLISKFTVPNFFFS